MIEIICRVITDEMLDWFINCGSPYHITAGKQQKHDIFMIGGQKATFAGKRDPDHIMFEDDKVALLFQIKYSDYIIDTVYRTRDGIYEQK